MVSDRRFPVEKIAKLDSPARRSRQPPGPLVELIASWSPDRLLDIGVGTGYFAIPLARALPAASILGLDVEPRLLEVAGQRLEDAGFDRVRLRPTDPDRIDAETDSRDLALMVALYHELDDRPAYLGEVRRVLGEGGRLVVCDWSPEGSHEAGPPMDHRISRGVVEQELAAAGFTAVTAHDLYSDFYVLEGKRGPTDE